jgi:hypothetical protein
MAFQVGFYITYEYGKGVRGKIRVSKRGALK